MTRDAVITALYGRLARIPWVVRLALKVRNIAAALACHRLSDGVALEGNGEGWLVATVAPRTALDVGANAGLWTLAVLEADPQARVVAYEPAPRTAERFRAAVGARAELVQAAVADAPGTMSFFQDDLPGNETSSLVPAAGRERYDVDVVTVDGELERLGLESVDLLKIDVEGYDLHVLRGARESLAAGRIRTVQFEYTAYWATAGSTLAAALRYLDDLGYDVRLLRASGLEPFDYAAFGEFLAYANFVATRRAEFPLR